MRNVLYAFLLMLFFVPHFSYAENSPVDQALLHHHRAQRVTSESKSRYSQKVDLNQASASDLMTLKGIGSKKASEIVAYRKAHGDFTTVKDLTKVKGIGKKTAVRLEKNNPGRIVVNKA